MWVGPLAVVELSAVRPIPLYYLAHKARSGCSVRVTWEPLADGRQLPVFELGE
jgi:hypothetical protein